MKSIIIIFFLALGFFLSFCSNKPSEIKEDEIVLLESRENKKYDLSAKFYGINFRYGENNEIEEKIIYYIIFQDKKTSREEKYVPHDNSAEGMPKVFFPDIWSPDEEYAILPMGKFEGFGIFKSKNILDSVREKKFIDKIRVGNVSGGSFWHDFEKWEDNSTFSFRAGLDGDMFAFKYNLAKSELYCYREACERLDLGKNLKGDVKPLKKGNIETLKTH